MGEYETRKRRPSTNERARMLRKAGNMAEAMLWNELKDRQLDGHKFVGQFPLGAYFADFLCRRSRLLVEVDGSQHADNSCDRHRDSFMRSQGYSVLRFWNSDVVKDIDGVCRTILAALDQKFARDVVAPDLRYVAADADAAAPHRLVALATSPQGGEETRRRRRT